MLNSLFSAEITDYVGLRYASVSVSAAKADEKVLNELDKFLTKAEVTDKQLTEEILTDFIATLTEVLQIILMPLDTRFLFQMCRL